MMIGVGVPYRVLTGKSYKQKILERAFYCKGPVGMIMAAPIRQFSAKPREERWGTIAIAFILLDGASDSVKWGWGKQVLMRG